MPRFNFIISHRNEPICITNMEKEETLQLKGIAILMMLYLHLFCHLEEVEQCKTFVNWINGKPLAYVFFRVGALCVPIYLFLSGYGFVKIYQKWGGVKCSFSNGQPAFMPITGSSF